MLVWCLQLAMAGPVEANWSVEYADGDTAFAAGTGINVRAAADPKAKVAASLPLGTSVKVVDAGGPVFTLGERTAAWVKITSEPGSGWVWSGALSKARVQADFDGDGQDETAVLAWRTDRHLALRISDGEAAEEIDLGTHGDIEGPNERATVEFQDPTLAGVPLVTVHVPGREMCGSGSWTGYISWDGKRPKNAISKFSWGDAPYYSVSELTWEPAKKRVKSEHRTTDDDAQNEIVTTQWYAWSNGAFEPQGAESKTTSKIE